MKILWFTNTASKYDHGKHSYNGGGWIESLEELVNKAESVELAISFFHNEGKEKMKRDKTIYYPIFVKPSRKAPIRKIINGLAGNLEVDEIIIPKLLKVVEDFKPDLIQIFGTEGVFAKIQSYTSIPVVIHIQGLINPYLNTYFPPNNSRINFLFSRYFFFQNLIGSGVYSSFLRFQNQAKREKEHLSTAKYFMGRTAWDQSVSQIFAPSANYFHVEEVLRPLFYDNAKTKYELHETIVIVSTLSATVYKGIDVVLKSAEQLKKQTNIKFIWNIVGLNEDNPLVKYFSNELQIKPENVNINFLGKKSSENLCSLLIDSDLFIHPSYIDNSPNSVCEAQILGIPVIACNVGGLSTIITHNETGILLPANGVFEIVSEVINYSQSPDRYFEMGIKARNKALARHDKKKIVKSLMESYLKIIK